MSFEDDLRNGFESEYIRINKVIKQNGISDSDVIEVRSIYNEAQVYGVDEDLIRRITNLRMSIESGK